LNLYQRDLLAQTVGSQIISDSTGSTKVFYNPSTQQVTSSFLQTDVAYRTASKSLNLTRLQVEMEALVDYSNCLKSANDLEYARLNLKNLEEQDKIWKVAVNAGLLSATDYNKSVNAKEQAEATIKMAESAWLKSVAALNKLIGKDENYRPILTYKPSITTYPRNSLETELLRGVPESSLIVSAKAALDVKEGSEYYPSTRTDSVIYNNGYEQTQINYEKAKKQAESQIESYYHNIDALEKKIAQYQLAYQQAEKDYKLIKVKYDLGLVPARSLNVNEISLANQELVLKKARIDLENAQNDLVQAKMGFAFYTGQEVYNKTDWVKISADDSGQKGEIK